jgi:hypothetical protein
MLPQADIPGRIGWMLRRGTTGPATSLIPNDDLTTGLFAAVFLCFNFGFALLLGFALDARARARSGGRTGPTRYWVALACVVTLYGALGVCASKECAVVGPGGFATQTLCSRVTIHRWPEVVEIRRLHNMGRLPSPHIDGSGSGPRIQSLQYKVIFEDGSIWESASSNNWAWHITQRAMHRAADWSHVQIKDYRRRG